MTSIMKKSAMKRTILLLALLLSLPCVFAGPSNSAGLAIAGSMMLGFFLLFFVFGGLMLLLTIFWVWMLIDAATRKNFRQENDKVVWILIIVFISWIGAIIYYFVIKRKLDRKKVKVVKRKKMHRKR